MEVNDAVYFWTCFCSSMQGHTVKDCSYISQNYCKSNNFRWHQHKSLGGVFPIIPKNIIMLILQIWDFLKNVLTNLKQKIWRICRTPYKFLYYEYIPILHNSQNSLEEGMHLESYLSNALGPRFCIPQARKKKEKTKREKWHQST